MRVKHTPGNTAYTSRYFTPDIGGGQNQAQN